jgi:hypothetical protein
MVFWIVTKLGLNNITVVSSFRKGDVPASFRNTSNGSVLATKPFVGPAISQPLLMRWMYDGHSLWQGTLIVSFSSFNSENPSIPVLSMGGTTNEQFLTSQLLDCDIKDDTDHPHNTAFQEVHPLKPPI